MFDYDNWNNYMDNWVDAYAKEFLDSVKSYLKNDTFVLEIAASLAWSHYNNKDCPIFFDNHGLTWNHALCYLDYICSNDNYKIEIDEAYQKYIEYLND